MEKVGVVYAMVGLRLTPPLPPGAPLPDPPPYPLIFLVAVVVNLAIPIAIAVLLTGRIRPGEIAGRSGRFWFFLFLYVLLLASIGLVAFLGVATRTNWEVQFAFIAALPMSVIPAAFTWQLDPFFSNNLEWVVDVGYPLFVAISLLGQVVWASLPPLLGRRLVVWSRARSARKGRTPSEKLQGDAALAVKRDQTL